MRYKSYWSQLFWTLWLLVFKASSDQFKITNITEIKYSIVLMNHGLGVFLSGTLWSPRSLVCTCCQSEWLNRSCGWWVGPEQPCAPLPCYASSMCFSTVATCTSSISWSAEYTPRTRYLSFLMRVKNPKGITWFNLFNQMWNKNPNLFL